MKITNKIESYEKIIELGLNRFPEKIFKNGENDKIINFLDKYPANYYAIRDKSKPRGLFKLKVEKDKIFDEINGYDKFSINVSSINFVKNQKLVGEILIERDNTVSLILSTNPAFSVRDAISNPDYNMKTNIFDNTLDAIPYFIEIYKYIVTNKLKDIIVEFAYFDTKVGINNENIIIYELRTDY